MEEGSSNRWRPRKKKRLACNMGTSHVKFPSMGIFYLYIPFKITRARQVNNASVLQLADTSEKEKQRVFLKFWGEKILEIAAVFAYF